MKAPGDASSVVAWIQRFPFGSSLPVQPLTCGFNSDGVELAFRRKKTDEKSGKDGGIVFVVRTDISVNAPLMVLEGWRDNEGQSISKTLAERTVL